MKFTTLFVTTIFASFAQTMAEPIPQGNAVAGPAQFVYHCDKPELKCPRGYRCCGPISEEFGGTCFKGETGICPL